MAAAAASRSGHVVVLGAGISGLTAAWCLRQLAGPALKISVLEKAPRTGGWIHTERSEKHGFLFERGPRGFRPSGSGIEALRLIDELGLTDQAIGTDPKSSDRWLWLDGQLQALPNGFGSLLTTNIGTNILKAVLREPFQSRRSSFTDEDDESVHSFVERRFGPFVADKMMDAMIGGIFAGDSKSLSVRSCFPILWELERDHGSIVLGMAKSSFLSALGRGSDDAAATPLSAACDKLRRSMQVSFVGGMDKITKDFTRRLVDDPNTDVIVDCDIQNIVSEPTKNVVRVAVGGGRGLSKGDNKSTNDFNAGDIHASHVISTISATQLGHAIEPQTNDNEQSLAADAASALKGIAKATSVAVVNVAFDGSQLAQRGFGHLVPSCEAEPALGVVWDSSVFPQNNVAGNDDETRVTVMMGGEHEHMAHLLKKSSSTGQYNNTIIEKTAVEIVRPHRLKHCLPSTELFVLFSDACVHRMQVSRHLNIEDAPAETRTGVAEGCIPQYTLGHRQRVSAAEEIVGRWSNGNLTFVGTSFYGLSPLAVSFVCQAVRGNSVEIC